MHLQVICGGAGEWLVGWDDLIASEELVAWLQGNPGLGEPIRREAAGAEQGVEGPIRGDLDRDCAYQRYNSRPL